MAGISVPDFWLGIMLILLFSLGLGALPSSGWVPLSQDPVENLRHLVLPACALGAGFAAGPVVKPRHGARYWARVTAGLDFSDADRVPPARFNRILWRGLKANRPYPKAARRTVAAIQNSPHADR